MLQSLPSRSPRPLSHPNPPIEEMQRSLASATARVTQLEKELVDRDRLVEIVQASNTSLDNTLAKKEQLLQVQQKALREKTKDHADSEKAFREQKPPAAQEMRRGGAAGQGQRSLGG